MVSFFAIPYLIQNELNLNEFIKSHCNFISKQESDFINKFSSSLYSKNSLSKYLHIITHGREKGLRIGNKVFGIDELNNYSLQINKWEFKRIFLWSCGVVKKLKFILRLRELTDAKIYFSDEELSQENPFLNSNKGDKFLLKEILNYLFYCNSKLFDYAYKEAFIYCNNFESFYFNNNFFKFLKKSPEFAEVSP